MPLALKKILLTGILLKGLLASIWFIFFLGLKVEAQPLAVNVKDTTSKSLNKKLICVSALAGAGYVVTLIELNNLWYSQSPKSKFHFFNDNLEWNQMDKMGHFYTSFYLSTCGIDLLKWGGLSQKKAILLDNILGLALLTPIEIMDGYSSAYGASWGDEVADAVGDVFAYVQYVMWKGIRVYPRFSYHTTLYSFLRPNILGSTYAERLLKDYNGQTYWLSTPISDWIKNKESKFPKWIGISMGYSSSGMVYADQILNESHGYNSYRRYFLSLDIYLSRIKTRNKFVNTIFYLTNMIHFPLPAVEYNTKQGIFFHPIYF